MSTTPAALKMSRRMSRLFPWFSALVLVAGIVAFTIVQFGTNTAKPLTTSGAPPRPVQVVKSEKSVAVPKEARLVAGRFILTAVQRKHLERAWPLVTDGIRQGQTHKQWMTGNIAVVPYPVDEVKYAPMKIDFSYPDEAMIEVALLPKKGASVRGLLFQMDLVKRHGKWLVNAWTPRSMPPVPSGSENSGGG